MEETSLQEFDNSALDLFRTSRPQTEEQESVEIRLESDFSCSKSISMKSGENSSSVFPIIFLNLLNKFFKII